MTEGQKTSEHKQSKLVIILSILLPVCSLVLDLLTEQNILNGTVLAVAGLISSALASMGYSYSRGVVKASKKRPVVVLSQHSNGD